MQCYQNPYIIIMLSESIHNNIIIKPSPIHGKGVFATKDIPKNTIVTLYPPHAIKINGNMIPHADPQNLKDFESNFNEYLRDYLACSSLSDSQMFIGNPNIISNSFAGHIINDACGNIFKNISFDETKKYPIFRNLVSDYYMKSIKNRNCRLVSDNNDLVICVETKKDIRAGDELLICYEPAYWFSYNYNNIDNIDNYDPNYCKTLITKMLLDPKFDPTFFTLIQNLKKFFE